MFSGFNTARKAAKDSQMLLYAASASQKQKFSTYFQEDRFNYPKQLTIYNNCQKTIIKRLKSLMSRGNDFMEHLKYNNAKSLNKKTKNKQRARNHS